MPGLCPGGAVALFLRGLVGPALGGTPDLSQDSVALVIADQASASGVSKQLLRVRQLEFPNPRRRPDDVQQGVRHRAPQDICYPWKSFQQG